MLNKTTVVSIKTNTHNHPFTDFTVLYYCAAVMMQDAIDSGLAVNPVIAAADVSRSEVIGGPQF